MQNSDPKPDPLLLHIRTAAERIGLPLYQVRRLIESGELPHIKLANRTYVPEAALASFIQDRAS